MPITCVIRSKDNADLMHAKQINNVDEKFVLDNINNIVSIIFDADCNEDAIINIANVIKTNNSVSCVIVNKINISDKLASELAEMIKFNTSLLWFHMNKLIEVSDYCAKKFEIAMQHNLTLIEIKMPKLPLDYIQQNNFMIRLILKDIMSPNVTKGNKSLAEWCFNIYGNVIYLYATRISSNISDDKILSCLVEHKRAYSLFADVHKSKKFPQDFLLPRVNNIIQNHFLPEYHISYRDKALKLEQEMSKLI